MRIVRSEDMMQQQVAQAAGDVSRLQQQLEREQDWLRELESAGATQQNVQDPGLWHSARVNTVHHSLLRIRASLERAEVVSQLEPNRESFLAAGVDVPGIVCTCCGKTKDLVVAYECKEELCQCYECGGGEGEEIALCQACVLEMFKLVDSD